MANVNLVAVVEGRVCDSFVTADSLVHELGKSLARAWQFSQFGHRLELASLSLVLLS